MAKLFSVLLAAVLSGGLAPLSAHAITPEVAEAHNLLTDSLVRRGITLYADAPACQTYPELEGYYNGSERALVLCNDGSLKMTEENLDTLRHETVHFIQDCADGTIDNTLRTVLQPGKAEELLEAAGLSAQHIEQAYVDLGKASHVPLEKEAFAVAATMDAGTINTALNIFCPVR